MTTQIFYTNRPVHRQQMTEVKVEICHGNSNRCLLDKEFK